MSNLHSSISGVKMDTHDYSIEGIVDYFEKHAEHVRGANEGQLEEWKDRYPDGPVPDALERPFNFSMALAVMASEIQLLKLKMGCD